MIVVTLTWSEVAMAAFVGTQRQLENLMKKRVDRYGADRRIGWQLHIDGAIGELAVAKHFGWFWSGSVGLLNRADVGAQTEVRTTRYDNGHLLVHKDDKDENVFYLAIIDEPLVTIVGYLTGRAAKREEWWKDHAGNDRPAYWVPQEAIVKLFPDPI